MIYLDNAATTHKKPKGVYKALARAYANPGRGGHWLSMHAGDVIYECRRQLATFFNAPNVENIVFTSNTTESLNIAIKGSLTVGDHVIVSGMEHNSVIRPLKAIGADVSIALPDENGCITPHEVVLHIRENTKLICITHASNLTGTINPIREIGAIAKNRGICFVVDAAQTAGVLPIDVKEDNIDILAFAGHKMLFGSQGTAGLYISPDYVLQPLKEGGTGSLSESMEQPDFMPDRFESGTMNTPGIAALHEGVKFVSKIGLKNIQKKEYALTKMLIKGLNDIEGVKIYGPKSEYERVGVTGFNIKGADSVMVCNSLSEKYKIAARGGMHCAPLAHRAMGTLDQGMIRFSISWFTTKKEIRTAVKAIKKIAQTL